MLALLFVHIIMHWNSPIASEKKIENNNNKNKILHAPVLSTYIMNSSYARVLDKRKGTRKEKRHDWTATRSDEKIGRS